MLTLVQFNMMLKKKNIRILFYWTQTDILGKYRY